MPGILISSPFSILKTFSASCLFLDCKVYSGHMKSKLIILCLLSFFWVAAKSFALAPKSQAKDELHPFDLATQDIITLENYQKIKNENKFLLSFDFLKNDSKDKDSDRIKIQKLEEYIRTVSKDFDGKITTHIRNIYHLRRIFISLYAKIDLFYVMTELIKNSFIHGNEMDLSLNVFIGWYVDEMGNFVIEIGDHGKNLDIDLSPKAELREYEKKSYRLSGGREAVKAILDLFSIEAILPVYNKDDIQSGKIIRLVHKLKKINSNKLNGYRKQFPKTWNFKTSRLENIPIILRDAA